MATWRPVDNRVWGDRKFLSLSEDGRVLWLFLLTTTFARSIPGVIVAGEAALSEELGWSVERYRKGFRELLEKGLSVSREGRLIWLKNALRYQRIAGPNSIKGMAKIWDNVPDGQLKHELWQALKVACKSWDRLFLKGFPEPIRNSLPNGLTQEQEQEQEQEQDQEQEIEEERATPAARAGLPPRELLKVKVDAATGDVGKRRARKPKPSEPMPDERAAAMRVLAKLTERNGVQYSGAKAHLALIVGRLREGIPEMDLRYVIAYCAAAKGWADDPKMQDSLRPETLFGPETIWRYLEPAKSWVNKLPPEDDQQQQPQAGAA